MSQHKRNSAFTSQLPDYERDVLNFGAKARRIRETRGLSLDNLANLTGIDKAALSRIENGTRIPKYVTFLRIVDALDSPLADFMPLRMMVHGSVFERSLCACLSKRELRQSDIFLPC